MAFPRNQSLPLTSEHWLANGGEMGARIQAFDWSRTSIGPIESWPQSLLTAVRIVLDSRYPMFVWWGANLINFYNDGYAPILGARHPDALGQPADQIWSDIWETVGPLVDGVMGEGRASWNEEQLLLMQRNGFTEETYFTFSYSPLPNDDGTIGGVFCACIEDTAEVLGRRRLRTLRELGFPATDGKKCVEDACQSACRALDANRYDLPFALLYLLDADTGQFRLAGHSGHIEAVLGSSPAPFRDGASWSLSAVVDSGEPVLVEGLATRFPGLGGNPWPDPVDRAMVLPLAHPGQDVLAGVLVAGISPRLPFSDEYRAFFELVAGHVAAALGEARAYEEERRRAEALAELDRAKTTFFSNVSHEFRTPLTLMLGPLEEILALSDTAPVGAVRDQVEVAHRNALRLQRLVNTLLDFSRIQADRVQAHYQPTDLALFTADLASTFRSLVERAGMRLVVACGPLPEPVYVDRDMWEKIVLNLLSNAFKFTFQGEIRITLRPRGRQVELQVQDTGTGIPEAELPRLFERFHRVTGAVGRTHEGTGIGLALVQELVHLHGGTLTVQSSEGVGSTFIVSLPFGRHHLPADRIGVLSSPADLSNRAIVYLEEGSRWLPDTASFSESPGVPRTGSDGLSAVGQEGEPARVLVVDDNADMREYTRRLLAPRYQVEVAADGREALQMLRSHPPDLVLSDVMMPVMDGCQLLRAIRSEGTMRTIPVILLSARAGEEAHLDGLGAGADDYITKPFSARELLARVAANLELARLRRDATAALQASEARLNAVLTSVGDHLASYDREWRYTYVNQQAAELLGKRPEELLGHRIWDLFPEGVGNPLYQELQRCRDEQRVGRSEHYYAPWGRWFENYIYRNEDGVTVFSADITARKEAERRLAGSEARFRALVEATAQVAWSWNPETQEGDFGAATEWWERLTGQPGAAQTVDGWLRMLHPEDQPAVAAAWEAALTHGTTFEVLYRVRKRSGEYLYLQSRAVPVRQDDGSIVEWVGMLIDVSEQQQIERERQELLEQIRLERARLDEALRQMPCGVSIADPSGKLIFASEEGERLIGHQNPSIAGYHEYSAYGAVHPDGTPYPPEEYPLARSLMTGEIVHQEEMPYQRPDGHRVTLSINSAPVRNRANQIVGAVCTFEDITPRKRTEEALRESEERFRTIVETAYEGIWLVDPEGRTLYVNERMLALLNTTRERLIAGTVFDYIFPEDLAAARERVVRNMAGQSEQLEFRFRREGGEELFVLASSSPIRDGSGRIVGALGMFSDMSDRRRLERELRQTAAELAERDRQKDQFLAMLAHELRNPLAPIRNVVELLGYQCGQDAALQRQREIVDRQVRHLTHMVDDLLDVSRITRGKIELRKQPVELAGLLRDAVSAAIPAARAGEGSLVLTGLSEPAWLEGDPTRLAQVFSNLLNNAVKFTPEEGSIDVSLEREASWGVIRLRDTGKGIPAPLLPHVFELFVQGERTLARSQGGLGIGLTMVKRLVELHGGFVEAFSEGPGRGSEFVVRLPLLPVQKAAPAGDQPGDGDSTVGQPGKSRRKRVLLIEDNADAAETMADLLELWGYDCRVAANGPSGLDQISTFGPDVVLLDIGLPGMDGYEVAQRLREERGYTRPLVAVTGYGQEEDRRRSRAAGFDRHLTKPVDPEELRHLLVEILGAGG